MGCSCAIVPFCRLRITAIVQLKQRAQWRPRRALAPTLWQHLCSATNVRPLRETNPRAVQQRVGIFASGFKCKARSSALRLAFLERSPPDITLIVKARLRAIAGSETFSSTPRKIIQLYGFTWRKRYKAYGFKAVLGLL